MTKLVGQTFDGASSMQSPEVGVGRRIQALHTVADYYHCSSHRNNLAASDASSVTHICDVISAVSEVITYFNASPKRTALLEAKCNELAPNEKGRLQKYSPTRWVERYTSLRIFDVTHFARDTHIVHAFRSFSCQSLPHWNSLRFRRTTRLRIALRPTVSSYAFRPSIAYTA